MQPLFFESFTKSGILKLADIWEFDKDNFISDESLYNKLKFKQNWLREWTIIKAGIKEYLQTNKYNNTTSGLQCKLKMNKLVNIKVKLQVLKTEV